MQVHVRTAAEAAAAEAAEIVILSCEADHTLPGIRAAAPSALISAGMPHGSSATPDEAVRAGFDALRRGADAICTVGTPPASSRPWRARAFPSPAMSDWCRIAWLPGPGFAPSGGPRKRR